MDIFAQKRLVTWVIALLVAVNLFSLGALWVTQTSRKPLPPPPQGHGPGREGSNVHDFLVRELNLTEEQEARVRQINQDQRRDRQIIEQGMMDLRRELMSQLAGPDVDRATIDQITAAIGARQAELEQLSFLHFEQIKSVCDGEQAARFEELLAEVLHRRPHQGHPPGGSPHDRPPRGHEPPGKNR